MKFYLDIWLAISYSPDILFKYLLIPRLSGIAKLKSSIKHQKGISFLKIYIPLILELRYLILVYSFIRIINRSTDVGVSRTDLPSR